MQTAHTLKELIEKTMAIPEAEGDVKSGVDDWGAPPLVRPPPVLELKSCYHAFHGAEPSYTNWTEDFDGYDYGWL